jgi:two-component system chemotaxis sensor kinase CheA
MSLADFERNAINEALKKNMHAFLVRVSVDPNCILKAARAFLVFKNLEGHGDIIKSEPSVQDIEDEKFDLDFNISIVTEESGDVVVGIIKDVSEIKDAIIEEIKTPFQEAAAPVEETKPEKKEVAKEESKPATADAKGSTAPAKAAAKAPAKAVGRSVRVDIEKLDVLMNLVSELIIAKNGLVSASALDRRARTM